MTPRLSGFRALWGTSPPPALGSLELQLLSNGSHFLPFQVNPPTKGPAEPFPQGMCRVLALLKRKARAGLSKGRRAKLGRMGGGGGSKKSRWRLGPPNRSEMGSGVNLANIYIYLIKTCSARGTHVLYFQGQSLFYLTSFSLSLFFGKLPIRFISFHDGFPCFGSGIFLPQVINIKN